MTLFAALLSGFGAVTVDAADLEKKKLQIFILAGQSNMVGHAHYITIPALLTAQEPGVTELAKLAFNEGGIAPGAARGQLETRIKRDKLNEALRTKKITGDDQITAAQEEVKKLQAEYDAGTGYEMAGIVWFQGFNDQFSPAFRDNYKNNMIAFVKDVRKEYQVPHMPFVIGVMGTSITKEEVDKNAVSVGQREAAAAAEFKGTVTSVESYPFYAVDAFEIFKKGWAQHLLEFSLVGSERPYHYMGSGKFFVRLGDALATAMVDLMKKTK